MTSSALAVPPSGIQLPRYNVYPPHIWSPEGDRAVEIGELFGIYLDEWQKYALRKSLATNNHKFLSTEVGLVLPRQNGKTEILLVRELAGLILFDEELILHSAHEYKSAAEAFMRIRDAIYNSPYESSFKPPRTSHGEESIETKDGKRLRFVARSRGSARGFTADCLVLDEAMFLAEQALAAMLFTLSARPNPQIWYASSAGQEDSEVLRRIRERAIEIEAGNLPPGRFTYLEWSADPKAKSDDEEAWAVANPALNIRIAPEWVRETELGAMSDVEFRRERMGIWDDAETLAVIPYEVWAGLIDRAVKPIAPYTFAVDVTPERNAASISMACKLPGGKSMVEVIQSRPGANWAVSELIELASRRDPAAVIVDSAGPAATFIPALEDAGLPVQVVSSRDVASACGMFYDTAMAGNLRHIDQPVLTAAVHAAKQRPLGDAWAWHRRDGTDISPLVAATLALFGAAKFAEPPRVRGSGKVIALD